MTGPSSIGRQLHHREQAIPASSNGTMSAEAAVSSRKACHKLCLELRQMGTLDTVVPSADPRDARMQAVCRGASHLEACQVGTGCQQGQLQVVGHHAAGEAQALHVGQLLHASQQVICTAASPEPKLARALSRHSWCTTR